MSNLDGKDAAARKDAPVYSGVLAYFPNALVEVAKLSKIGNDQHNAGQPMHWSKGKSCDHGDCMVRHQLDFESVDTDGMLHATKVAWRALAQLETLLEGIAAGRTYAQHIAALKGGMSAFTAVPAYLDANGAYHPERRKGPECRREVFVYDSPARRAGGFYGRRVTDATRYDWLPIRQDAKKPIKAGDLSTHADDGDEGVVECVFACVPEGGVCTVDGAVVRWSATGICAWYPLSDLKAV